MKQVVAKYIKYYKLDRLHTANEGMTPANFENYQRKVSCLGWSVHHALKLTNREQFLNVRKIVVLDWAIVQNKEKEES